MTIDSHCHIHDEKFRLDLDAVLLRAKNANISHLITIGCDIDTTKAARLKAQQFDHIFFTAGFHPHEAKHALAASLYELATLAQDKKCVAIGECGLDYYYLHSTIEEQKRAFSAQLDLATHLNLPVVIHLRDAFDDCVAILKEHASILGRTVIHCFSGSLSEAKIFLSLGCFISLSGIITFKKPGDLLEVAKEAPLDKLLVETDCPYLAPHPHRGQRNEPAFINLTLNAIAEARGQEIDVVAQQIHENTMNFFNLSRTK